MSQMRFIVSHYIFAEHPSFEKANNERLRLSELFPHKKFKVYCITEEYENPECCDPKRKSKIKTKYQPIPIEKPKITLANFKEKRQQKGA